MEKIGITPIFMCVTFYSDLANKNYVTYESEEEILWNIYRNFKYAHEHHNHESWLSTKEFNDEVYFRECLYKEPLRTPELIMIWKCLAEKKYVDHHFPEIFDYKKATIYPHEIVLRIK